MKPIHLLLVIIFFFLLVLIFGLLIKPKSSSSSFNPALLKPSGKINLNKITVAMDINDILTHKPTKPGNAAELYIKAFTSPTLGSIDLSSSGQFPKTYNINAPELAFVEQAALVKDCQFIPQYLLPLTTYDVFTAWKQGPPYRIPLGSEIDLPEALTQKGDSLRAKGKTEEAIHEYESAILFCHRIIKEPTSGMIHFGEYYVIQEPLENLVNLYRARGNIIVADTCQVYLEQVRNVASENMKLLRSIYPYSSSNLPNWAQDAMYRIYYQGKTQDSINSMIEIALFDKDPIWRQEEILALGIFRFDTYKRIFGMRVPSPYKTQIENVLKYISTHDSDSTIRLTADNALKLKNYNP